MLIPQLKKLVLSNRVAIKIKGKRIVSTDDQVGLELLGPSMTVTSRSPDPLGYSLSVFIPPGLPGAEAGI